jgi:hypothetical protein
MKTTKFKFILNIFLFITFLFLMDEWSFLGIAFHEIAGLAICLFYILHKALNWPFIKETTCRLFGKIAGRSRINYIIDVLLLAGFTLIIISGMGIAKTIDFTWLGFTKENFIIWRFMHTSVSMIVLMLAGVHVGMHWSWVRARFSGSGIEKKNTTGRKVIYAVLVAVIVTGAVYSYKSLDFGGKTTILFKIVSGDQDMMMRRPPKLPPGGTSAFKPPEGFRGGQHDEFTRPDGVGPPGEQGVQGLSRGKGMHGKPGAGKIISLRNVIPYAFILAFFILVTRVLDVSIRKRLQVRSSDRA